MKKQPKDYADRTWLEEAQDWEYKNKETYKDIALYFAYLITACVFGYAFYGAFLS